MPREGNAYGGGGSVLAARKTVGKGKYIFILECLWLNVTLTQFHTLPPLEIPPWKRCIPADLMKPSLPEMGNGGLGKKAAGAGSIERMV